MNRLLKPGRILLAAGSVSLTQEKPREKLPIYSSESSKLEVVEAPTQLEAGIREAREKLTETYSIGRSHLQMVVDRWIGVEHAVESRMKSLAPPPEVEPIFPGILWVGVATLTGSIFSLRRPMITRIFYPPLFGIASAYYFLPHTFKNVTSYTMQLEEQYTPGLAAFQKETAKTYRASLNDTKVWLHKQRGSLDTQTEKLLKMVREQTGLQIGVDKDAGKK